MVIPEKKKEKVFIESLGGKGATHKFLPQAPAIINSPMHKVIFVSNLVNCVTVRSRTTNAYGSGLKTEAKVKVLQLRILPSPKVNFQKE